MFGQVEPLVAAINLMLVPGRFFKICHQNCLLLLVTFMTPPSLNRSINLFRAFELNSLKTNKIVTYLSFLGTTN